MALSLRFAAALLAAACLPASALELAPVDQGTVERTSSLLGTDVVHDATSTTASVRQFFFGGGVGSVSIVQRAYALFEVPAALAQPVAAVLRFTVNAEGVPFNGSVSAFDVTSAPAAFEVSHTSGIAGQPLFLDLGDGAAYGDAALASQVLNSVALVLSGQALADLAAARGGVFGIGLTGGLGGGTFGLPTALQGIVLDITPVPEPGSAPLALAGLLGLGWVLARRSRR